MRVNRDIQQIILFVFVIIGLALAFRYPQTIVKRPQSVHNWRQCDGLSLTLSYYQEGMDFFHPQTHMIHSDGHTTGYTAPSEAPLLYYSVAFLYQLFGEHEIIFRGLNLLIFLAGLFFLYKLSIKILKDSFFPAIVLVLIFSSPVLIYYGNNFLPNTTALSMSFIGWYFFFSYYEDGKTITFMKSMLFFALACLMKVTELAGLTIIVGMMLAERLRIIPFQINKGKHVIAKISVIFIIYLLCAGWILYARHYNSVHATNQFMTYTVPIWDMNSDAIRLTLHKMHDLWFKDYLYPPTFYGMLGALVIMFIYYKKSHRILLFASACMIIAWAAYSLLFFLNLGDHDYFYISFYILPVLVFINLFYLLKQIPLSKVAMRSIQTALVLFAILNVVHGSKRHQMRYKIEWMNDYKQNISLYRIRPWLDENGISSKDSVIFYPSAYIRPLYLMNRKGWVMDLHDRNDTTSMRYDSLEMQKVMKYGARYLITNRIDSALKYKPLQPYLKDLHRRFDDIYIFNIPPKKANFNRSDHP